MRNGHDFVATNWDRRGGTGDSALSTQRYPKLCPSGASISPGSGQARKRSAITFGKPLDSLSMRPRTMTNGVPRTSSALPLLERGVDDHVGEAELVFEQEETSPRSPSAAAGA